MTFRIMTPKKGLICDTHQNDTQHNNALPLCWCRHAECYFAECYFAECCIIFIATLNAIMLSVIMLSVMAPCPGVCSMVQWYLIAQQFTMWDSNVFYTLISDKLKLTGKIWAKFSNLNVGMFINTLQLHSWPKQPNLSWILGPNNYLVISC
jgi:hypothetical protein